MIKLEYVRETEDIWNEFKKYDITCECGNEIEEWNEDLLDMDEIVCTHCGNKYVVFENFNYEYFICEKL
jgi:DNA-directed RNA polymerase subunit RPC12/RpoP